MEWIRNQGQLIPSKPDNISTYQNRHDEKDAEETRQDKIRLFTSADREACSTMLLLLISTSAVTVVSFNSCPRIYIHMT